ncbi:hypothetical protein IC582_014210 [Cucumis melo]
MAVCWSFMKPNHFCFSTNQPPFPKFTNYSTKQLLICRASRNEVDHGEKRKTRSEEIERKTNNNNVFSGEKPITPWLDKVSYPIHMKNLSLQVLKLGYFILLYFVF